MTKSPLSGVFLFRSEPSKRTPTARCVLFNKKHRWIVIEFLQGIWYDYKTKMTFIILKKQKNSQSG